MKHRINASGATLVIITLMLLVISSNVNWGRDHWKNIIEADGKGYYAYLPAVFIYHDLNFGFFDHIEKEKYYSVHTYYDYRSSSNGKVISKYYAGIAVAQLPFFITAHGLSKVFGFETDGYSKLYNIFVNLAGIFYLLVGLIFIGKILKRYNISSVHRAMTFVVIVFGTNLFYYSISEPGMSHVYSFAFFSIFLFCVLRYFEGFQKKYIPLLAALLGLIVLIRPVNGMIVLAIPFMAGNFKVLKKGFMSLFSSLPYLISSIIIFISVIFLQLLIYKISTGKFFVYSYVNEFFDFSSPHMIDILFSYRKGLFLYTPIYLVSLTGLIFLWKTERYRFFTWIGFFIALTYVLSSWWMWYYGGSFSSRVYVEYLPMFAILLGIALNGMKHKKLKSLFLGLVVLLVLICQIQTYQYRYNQIHWSEMNKEMYWDVFLRIDRLI